MAARAVDGTTPPRWSSRQPWLTVRQQKRPESVRGTGRALVTPVEKEPLANNRKTLDWQNDEAPGFKFQLYRLRRYNADPETGLHGLFDRFVAAQFAAGPVGQLIGREMPLDCRTRA